MTADRAPAASRHKLHIVASSAPEAVVARERLIARYGDQPAESADIIVALGGDGLMLATLHASMGSNKPIYGMNRGSVGFLTNDFAEDGLRERLDAAVRTVIHPLIMRVIDASGVEHKGWAINEVSIWRQSYQAAKLAISVDDKERLAELSCDGVLVATPAGSTAYNLSAQGPIIPIGSALLALTPLNPFRPRRWRGALLANRARIMVRVLESEKRPVAAVADHFEVRDAVEIHIAEDPSIALPLLFDPDHNLDERILREQFGN
ncbi:NAD kinase [Candidatus Raskinella chloraquaticus]|uniref:NAD kinase n=1 Tax=Candidatus Raskinella chloraquaticus TaxID=1951219 RepID=A0A1W9HXE4_9HYPH|nr:MAG: NAD kinase [Proteobacteria bacterium SG_bin8]